MLRKLFYLLVIGSTLLFPGCAIFGDVINNPGIQVREFKSLWITPEQWSISCWVKVKNPNPLTLSFSRAVCTLRVKGRQIQMKVLTGLSVIPAYDTQTYEIPMLLSMKALREAVGPGVKTLGLDIDGHFYPQDEEQQAPLPYVYHTEIKFPVLPDVRCQQLKMLPQNLGLGSTWQVTNRNDFPLKISAATGVMQSRKFKLKCLPLALPIPIKPGETATLLLNTGKQAQPESLAGQKISLAIEIEAESPVGKMIIPATQDMQL